jgi:hypothetical protein
LGVGKIGEEEAATKSDDPWPHTGARSAKQNYGRNQKKKVIVPRIENHEEKSAAFSTQQIGEAKRGSVGVIETRITLCLKEL